MYGWTTLSDAGTAVQALKPLKVITNSEPLRMALGLRCNHCGSHQRISSGRTKSTEHYPEAFAKLINTSLHTGLQPTKTTKSASTFASALCAPAYHCMAPKADAKARPSRAKPKETAPKETANRDHMDGMTLRSLAIAEQEPSVAGADVASAKGKAKQKKLPKVISEEGRVRFAPRKESLLVDQVVRGFVPEEPDPVQTGTVHRTQSQEISGLVASGWLQKPDEHERARIQHMEFEEFLGEPIDVCAEQSKSGDFNSHRQLHGNR